MNFVIKVGTCLLKCCDKVTLSTVKEKTMTEVTHVTDVVHVTLNSASNKLSTAMASSVKS